MTTPYYERTLDSFADHTITKCTDKPSANGFYNATLDTGPNGSLSDPDFAPHGYGKTREEAIAKCAAAIRADARGIGKFAPHSCFQGYDFHWRLAKYWSEKEQRTPTIEQETPTSLGEQNMADLPNFFFEHLPRRPDIECPNNKCYIYTDGNGQRHLVIMEGQHQREQQEQLDRWAEETISRKLYAKGYRYRCEPKSRRFAALYVKRLDEIGPLLRSYPDERFDVNLINEHGEQGRRVAH